MTDKIVALTTCGSEEEARTVARTLVGAKLAACVNVLPPMHSVYRWRGAIEEAAEWLLVIKTRRALFPRIEAVLRRVHSYELPELLALPVVDGLPDYLGWIDEETKDSGED